VSGVDFRRHGLLSSRPHDCDDDEEITRESPVYITCGVARQTACHSSDADRLNAISQQTAICQELSIPSTKTTNGRTGVHGPAYGSSRISNIDRGCEGAAEWDVRYSLTRRYWKWHRRDLKSGRRARPWAARAARGSSCLIRRHIFRTPPDLRPQWMWLWFIRQSLQQPMFVSRSWRPPRIDKHDGYVCRGWSMSTVSSQHSYKSPSPECGVRNASWTKHKAKQ